MNKKIAWSDYFGKLTELTEEEINWFMGIVDIAKKATGYDDVQILPYNHELYDRKYRDTLGICVIPCEGDAHITIDTYFIHEKYEECFNDWFAVERESLEHVIAHELAHLTVWRHGKKHNEKTEELYALIMNAIEAQDQEKESGNESAPVPVVIEREEWNENTELQSVACHRVSLRELPEGP